MRKILILIALVALPAAAQNTDIESLSGLQFNFGNPGARSLGMGGAFLGLADDASAAEANPAGLTILRKPEISFEGRNFEEQQLFTTSGTFPTHGALFVGLLIGTVLILGALAFFPALSLGPIVEHYLMHQGKLF